MTYKEAFHRVSWRYGFSIRGINIIILPLEEKTCWVFIKKEKTLLLIYKQEKLIENVFKLF